MAIKSISQLDRFDNKTTDQGAIAIGGNLKFFNSDSNPIDDKINKGKYYNFLTDSDKSCVLAQTRTQGSATTPFNNFSSTSSYWSSLFEISKPIPYSTTTSETDAATEYESQSITYEKLMENILWDVKSYLNGRNNLNDYDLLSVIQRNYWFDGNKTFNNNVSVQNNLSIAQRLTCDGFADFNDSIDVLQNATIHNNATVNNIAYIKNLSVHNTLSIDCNVSCSSRNLIFDGWSFGLIDRSDNTITDTTVSTGYAEFVPTNAGTYGTTSTTIDITDGLSGAPSRTGDPVCFKDGRPYELTAVNYANYAMSAYILVNRDGSLLSAGNGEIRTVDGIVGTATDTYSKYSAMFIHDGIISATNVIDFAEHAYWSDLGERYLADDIYDPGTLVKFGGEKEITIADDEVNAIVSTKAFDLNAGLVGGTVIALCGRVPTKVKGKIEKFDKIMLSDIPGVACKWDGVSRVIGRALENNLDENIKLVECVTRFAI